MSFVYPEYSEKLIENSVLGYIEKLHILLQEASTKLSTDDYYFEVCNALNALTEVEAVEAFELLLSAVSQSNQPLDSQIIRNYRPEAFNKYLEIQQEKLYQVRQIKQERTRALSSSTVVLGQDGRIAVVVAE
jgi:hypothetical protein